MLPGITSIKSRLMFNPLYYGFLDTCEEFIEVGIEVIYTQNNIGSWMLFIFILAVIQQ